ncbi:MULTISPECIES: helix-turn-helix transcriptional regulator [unclassified Leclercia]|uniref:Helix-turn-helix transcriptional regulator n=1 Tax=Leclercia barmai TaxID=2785629 RepID=A0ABS7RS42_9ENTR|nr:MULTISPECIES: helix-turn-helix transcriptional regulator [unclassified Leclercia]MBZ0057131.1 helix-turn-helix transcriptional regulator [Leclercia sp. EMC7]MCM5695306.1 helix-turn-helix domain-containing protein [Leclercia sp. LTM01]MCM5699713.1 helix-turn-helix domain-containing protein [Leclercia sp. LTM14]
MNENIKKVMAEKRRMTIGQLTDLLISGNLRRELRLSKTDFSELIDVTRATVRRVEGFEGTPSMRMVLNTAATLRIGIDFPECGHVEVVPKRSR